MPMRRLLFISMGSALAGVAVAATALLVIAPKLSASAPHLAGHQHAAASTASLCSISPSQNSQAAFLQEMADVNARMHAAMEIVPTGDVDQDFIRMMIPHHQGAIDMARVLLKYQPDERLRRLAQSIIVEQTQEIVYMRTLQDQPSAGASSPALPPANKDQ
jgi:uncharacterized protein (DUF305 family)